jgi:hypothetical protein
LKGDTALPAVPGPSVNFDFVDEHLKKPHPSFTLVRGTDASAVSGLANEIKKGEAQASPGTFFYWISCWPAPLPPPLC